MQSVPKISRQNNLDFLRILFAILVFIQHFCIVTDFQEFKPLLKFIYPLSSKSVPGFFIVSGFLIFMSYENSNSLKGYIEKRIRRIAPAYYFVVVTSACVGILLSNLDWGRYITSPDLFKYLFANIIFMNFLQPSLPGVFEDNSFGSAINGSLWTIKIEVMFYLVVPIIAMVLHKFNKLLVVIIIYILSFSYKEGLHTIAEQTGQSFLIELGLQLPGQLSFFLSGCLLYYYFESFKTKYQYFLIPSTAVIIVDSFTQSQLLLIRLLLPIALSVIVVSIAFFTPQLKIFSKYGDFSYGIYIYHFPIIQFFISLGIFQNNHFMFFSTVTILLMLTAYCSWRWIEKPFLQSKVDIKSI